MKLSDLQVGENYWVVDLIINRNYSFNIFSRRPVLKKLTYKLKDGSLTKLRFENFEIIIGERYERYNLDLEKITPSCGESNWGIYKTEDEAIDFWDTVINIRVKDINNSLNKVLTRLGNLLWTVE